MGNRSLGWVQNPSRFTHLKRVVSIFCKTSETHVSLLDTLIPTLVKDEALKTEMIKALSQDKLEIKYSLLKGRGAGGKTRAEAPCTGLVQAVIPAQSGRPYTDDWTADGFLRWAISVGFLKYNRGKDTCEILDLGRRYVEAEEGSSAEKSILKQAFLSYPPAVRILGLLEEGKHLTKFDIGAQLGGLGEAGFTSIPEDLYIQGIQSAPADEKGRIRANTEGSADKYARMIAGWLTKVGLVQKIPKTRTVRVGNKTYETNIGHAYRITLEGIKELKRTRGTSSTKRIPKIVYWEMLATKTSDRDYIRNRRGQIVLGLENKEKSLADIKKLLEENEMEEEEITIKDEIEVIKAMGLNVQETRGIYTIRDDIVRLEVPNKKPTKTNVLKLKDRLRTDFEYLNHRYLSLVDLAYDGNLNRDFEIQTIDLFTNELQFNGLHLGHSRRPDGIIYFAEQGLIIDNKAYKSGFELPISQADEMIRYIVEAQKKDIRLNPNGWWLHFGPAVQRFYFLFITSYLKGRFESNLDYIAKRTGTQGAAINIENLLTLAELMKSGEITFNTFFELFKNKEIKREDIRPCEDQA